MAAGRDCLYLVMEDDGAAASGLDDGLGTMDGAVWSKLPEDLLHLVLLRVPVLSLRRFMCVSRRWRRLIADPVFARECAAMAAALGTAAATTSLCCFGGLVETTGRAGAVVRLPPHGGTAHSGSPTVLRARRIDVASLLPRSVTAQRLQHPPPAPLALDLWASDKGLLCFSKRKQGYGETFLYICNPVTRAWQALPPLRFDEFEMLHRAFLQVDDDHGDQAHPLLHRRRFHVVLLANTLAGNCRIFVHSGSSSSSVTAATATSTAAGWRHMDWNIPAPSGNREPVLCRGVVHAWRACPGSEKLDDSSFCVATGREVPVPPLPPASFRKLLYLDGALFLACFQDRPFAGIAVWKLLQLPQRHGGGATVTGDDESAAGAGTCHGAQWRLDSVCPAHDYARLTGARTAPVVARLRVGAVGARFICLCADKSMLRPALAYDTRAGTWCSWDFGLADPRNRTKMFSFHASCF